MEYQVPQFIEVEDKVVGPLTLKQFIYVAGSAGICVACFFYLPLIVAALVAIPVGVLGALLAFYKMNGKPFVEILEAGFNYYTGGKLFLWKHEDTKQPRQGSTVPAPEQPVAAPRLTPEKLSELAWSLDVKQGSGNPES